MRDIALAAGANPGSVTYHFTTKDGLLLEIYRRHCGPMNLRRSELLAAARRVRDLQDRLEAIVRAYVLPAFTSGSDLAGGGARFTRLRAVMSAEGNEVVRKIIAQTFDDTSHAFIDAIHESLPHIPRDRDRLAQPFPARRAVLFAGDAGARVAAVARRRRRQRMPATPSSNWCAPPWPRCRRRRSIRPEPPRRRGRDVHADNSRA